MNLSSLQTLTWGTVAAAIVSALTLAAAESSVGGRDRAPATGRHAALPLPAEPTAAGPPPAKAASAGVGAAAHQTVPAAL